MKIRIANKIVNRSPGNYTRAQLHKAYKKQLKIEARINKTKLTNFLNDDSLFDGEWQKCSIIPEGTTTVYIRKLKVKEKE